MIKHDGQICYSPLPPNDYARWVNGRPVGPAAIAVDRATGCNLARDHGQSGGIHQWNLAWLLTPAWDRIAELNRAGKLIAAEFTDLQRLADIFNFADQYASWLMEPPDKFLTRMSRLKIKMPTELSMEDLMKRAGVTTTEDAALGPQIEQPEASNVIQGKFRK